MVGFSGHEQCMVVGRILAAIDVHEDCYILVLARTFVRDVEEVGGDEVEVVGVVSAASPRSW